MDSGQRCGRCGWVEADVDSSETGKSANYLFEMEDVTPHMCNTGQTGTIINYNQIDDEKKTKKKRKNQQLSRKQKE